MTIRPCTNCNSGIATSQDCVGKNKEKTKKFMQHSNQHWHRHKPRLCRKTKRKSKSLCNTPTNTGTSQDCIVKTCNKKTMLQMHWHCFWRLQLESTLEISSVLANSAHPIISYHFKYYHIISCLKNLFGLFTHVFNSYHFTSYQEEEVIKREEKPQLLCRRK